MFIDYYVGISFLQNKFAFGDGGVNLQFTWKDSLTFEKKSSNSLWFELNSILYNLGALINNFGTHTPIEGEAIAVVSKKFQEAAWIFNYLKEFGKNLPPSVRTHDFTLENLSFLSTLQLS